MNTENKSIGVFIDGGYYAKINEALQDNLSTNVSISGLFSFIRSEVARRHGLSLDECFITEAHYFRGRYRAHDANGKHLLFSERKFEDTLIENDVIFHYKHLREIQKDGELTEDELKEKTFMIDRYFHDIEKEAMRDMVLTERTRLDGRKLDEIRPIWCEVDYLPSAHGSSIFTRGETQSLSTVTLGTKLDEQLIDGAVIEGTRNFMLHYNFPGFATGEVKGNRGLSRREIGHGNLAWRALKYVIPEGPENPYTIRVVSEILETEAHEILRVKRNGLNDVLIPYVGKINIVHGIMCLAWGMKNLVIS